MENRRFHFASLVHKAKSAYLVTADHFAMMQPGYRKDGVAFWACMYDTYGDGIGQHSSEYVVPREYFADFMASLATHLLKTNDEHHLHTVASHWPSMPDRNLVMFLHGEVRYDENKKRYYNTVENKVSSSDSKRFHREWNVVPEWANGSAAAVYRLIHEPNYPSIIIDQYAKYDYIWRTIADTTNHYCKRTAEWLSINEVDKHVDSAFGAVNSLVKSYKEKQNAVRSLECYMSNHEELITS